MTEIPAGPHLNLLAPCGDPGTVIAVTATTRLRCEALAERIEVLREEFSQGGEPSVDDGLRFRFEAVPQAPDLHEQISGTL
jgi:hypothetical protein